MKTEQKCVSSKRNIHDVSVWRKGESIWVPDGFLVLSPQEASLLGPAFEFHEMSLCPLSNLPLLLIYINKFKYFVLLITK